jgi:hypothetical protein
VGLQKSERCNGRIAVTEDDRADIAGQLIGAQLIYITDLQSNGQG